MRAEKCCLKRYLKSHKILPEIHQILEANFLKGNHHFNFVLEMTEKKTFVLSDETVNSNGFRVKTAGINLDRFKKNPVMLDLHDRGKVLGRWENIRIENGQLLADTVWDEEDPDAKRIKGKVDRGFIKGASSGLGEPFAFSLADDGTPELTSCVLKEASIASVPSNENSLILYDKNGSIMQPEQIITLTDSVKNNNSTIINEMKNPKLFAKVLNLADTVAEDEILVAVQNLSDENKTIKAENATLKAAQVQAAKDKVIALVDGAVSANKILPAEKDDYIALATSNYDTTKKLLDAKKAHVSISSQLNEADKNFSDKTKDWTWDDFHKKGKLVELKDKDLTRYETLYEEKYGKKPSGK